MCVCIGLVRLGFLACQVDFDKIKSSTTTMNCALVHVTPVHTSLIRNHNKPVPSKKKETEDDVKWLPLRFCLSVGGTSVTKEPGLYLKWVE